MSGQDRGEMSRISVNRTPRPILTELARPVLADSRIMLAVHGALTLVVHDGLLLLHPLPRGTGRQHGVVLARVGVEEAVVPRHGELGHDARPELVPAAQRLVVHLRRRHGVAEVVLVQEGRGGRVEERVDVADGLVRARPLLEVDRGRV